MLIKEIIRKKRDGKILTDEEIHAFIAGVPEGSVSREQISAFTMAVFFKSMTIGEISALTKAMMNSGEVINWKPYDLGGPVVDKHSTGGVGDKVSLMLAPMAAACGCFVPMISGRGLGHTGGTLDKIEAISGYNAVPDLKLLAKVVKDVGCAIVGQTSEIAPADRVIYSVRDVTATVESIPLITASILSKKLAAGLDVLVMDVKTGAGAFMETEQQSEELARSIMRTAAENNTPTHAVMTGMDEVLGFTAGNALEVLETVEYLTGKKKDAKLHKVVMALCTEMLILAKLVSTREEAEQKLEQALSSGAAAEKFSKMVAALGGANDFIEKPHNYLDSANIIKPIYAQEAGYVSAIDVRKLGNIIVKLGGGRSVPMQKLDMSVGLADVASLGDYLDKSRPIAYVHADNETDIKAVTEDLEEAFTLADHAPKNQNIIRKLMTV